jgi:copper resistance protein D
MSGWELVVLLSKSLTYLAMLAIPGVLMVHFLLQRADPRSESALSPVFLRQLLLHYLIPAVILGILSLCLFFLAQVGAVNQQGVAGMFDQDMAAIMAITALGEGVQLRFYGFMLAALAAGLMFLALRAPRSGQHWHWPITTLLVAGAALFAWSFAVLGHTSVLGSTARAAVVLHLLSVGVWVGALIPLWLLCRVNERHSGLNIYRSGRTENERTDNGMQLLTRIMEEFGKAGWCFIPLLLFSGIFLLFNLVEAPGDLSGSVYGRLLLAKMIAVGGLMTLGARNKFRLVPSLRDTGQFPANVLGLRRSIQWEMGLAVLILVLVASFTTAFGPMA